MSEENFANTELCSECEAAPAAYEGMCEICYSESIEGNWERKDNKKKDQMVKHGQSLKSDYELNKNRAVKGMAKKMKK